MDKNLKRLLIAILALSAVVFVITAASALKQVLVPTPVSTTLPQISKFTTLKFPPGTVLLGGSYTRALSSRITAKLTMPVSQLTPFTAQPLLARHLSKTDSDIIRRHNDFPTFAQNSWHIGAVKHFLAADGVQLPNKVAGVWLLIDLDGKKDAIVYLCFED